MKLQIHNTSCAITMLEDLGYIEKSYDPMHKYIRVKGQKYWSTDESPGEYIFDDHFPGGPYDSDPLYLKLEKNRELQKEMLDFLKDNFSINLKVEPKYIGCLLLKAEVYIGGESISKGLWKIIQDPRGFWKIIR